MPTPDQIDAMPEYTDAQILKLYRKALVLGWGGTTRVIDGRTVTFPPPSQILDLIERLEDRVAADSDDADGDGLSLAVFRPSR